MAQIQREVLCPLIMPTLNVGPHRHTDGWGRFLACFRDFRLTAACWAASVTFLWSSLHISSSGISESSLDHYQTKIADTLDGYLLLFENESTLETLGKAPYEVIHMVQTL